jgi:hypothetical protein
MNEEANEFEATESLLRSLPLRTPSRALDERVLQAIRRKSRAGWIWAGVAASLAAAAAVVIAVQSNTAVPVQQPQAVQVASAQPQGELVQTEVQWTEDGIVGTAKEGPVRQYTVQTVKQISCSTDYGPAVITIPEEQTVYLLSRAY